jgi:hypothetical protein
VLRVHFVYRSGVSRGAKMLHRIESSNMLLIFSPCKGRFCALTQGWGAHLSDIFLPCLPLRAGGRASMRFPRQFRGGRTGYSYLSPLSIYLYTYLCIYLFSHTSAHIHTHSVKGSRRSSNNSKNIIISLSHSLSIYLFIYYPYICDISTYNSEMQ